MPRQLRGVAVAVPQVQNVMRRSSCVHHRRDSLSAPLTHERGAEIHLMTRPLLFVTCVFATVAISASAGETTWYFRGEVESVNDVFGNASDDPTFAADGYAIGTVVTGFVTIDPAAASQDYDDGCALNLDGPDDPQIGFYFDAITNFGYQIGSNVQADDALTYRVTIDDNPCAKAGAIQVLDNADGGSSVTGDQYSIFLPGLNDDFTWTPPDTSTYPDANGWEPILEESDIVFPALYFNEWLFGEIPTLVDGDDPMPDLEGRHELGVFSLQMTSPGASTHDVTVTFDLTHFSQTPVPEPSTGILGASAILSLFALRKRQPD